MGLFLWEVLAVEIEKKSIDFVKTVYEGDIKSSAEGSIIVSDTKPDVLRVVEATAEAYLADKQIEDGKITLSGRVRVNILYMPEGDDGKMESVSGNLEFCETLKRSEFKENMTLCAFCDVDKVSYKVLNSRKIGIETKIMISVSVFANEQAETVSGVLSDNAETREKELSLTSSEQYDEFVFSVDEEIEFPKGQRAEKLLKADMCLLSKEQRALDGKFVIKGRLGICILYSDSYGKYAHLDCEVPFTEVFDISGLAEDEECEVSVEIGETAYELINAAEDTSSLRVNAEVTVGVKTEKEDAVSVMDDCYFTDCDCEFSYAELKLQSAAEQVSFSAVLKQLLEKEPSSPDIASVYKVQAKPFIIASKIENGKLCVSGKTVIYVLYLTNDAENPIASIKDEVPFNYSIDCDGEIAENNRTVLDAKCENISYVINSKDAVEVRCGLEISGKIINVFDGKIISDIKTEPRADKKQGIAVYFVKDGENLWDIARSYHIKTDSILSANGLAADYSPTCGEKLIIPLL